MDSRYKRLGKNTFLVLVGNVGSKLIGLLMLPFYTRFLSATEYGVTDLISTYSAILLSLVSCCVADAIFIFPKNANHEGRSKYFSSGLIFSIAAFTFCALVFFFLKIVESHHSFGGTFMSDLWWIYAMTACMFFQSYTQQFNRSTDQMTVFSLTGIVLTLSLALFAFLLLPKYGLNGYLWSILAANMVAVLFSIMASRSYKYFSIQNMDWMYLKELLLYGIPLIPNSMMWWFVNGVNKPIMEAHLGLSAVGIYAVANKFPSILAMLSTVFTNAWGISVLEEFDKSDFNSFFNRTVRMIYYFVIIAGCIITVSSKVIVTVFAANEYFEAWRYIPTLTLGVILQSLSGTIGGIFMAEKKSKYFFYSSLWGAISSLLLTYILVIYLGLMGATIAIIGSFLCMVIVRLKYAWEYISQFDIIYFCIVLFLYTGLIVLVVLDTHVSVNLIACILVMGVMSILNKDLLIRLPKILFHKVKLINMKP